MERVVALLVTQRAGLSRVGSWPCPLSLHVRSQAPCLPTRWTASPAITCGLLPITFQVLCPACWGLGRTHFLWAPELAPLPSLPPQWSRGPSSSCCSAAWNPRDALGTVP